MLKILLQIRCAEGQCVYDECNLFGVGINAPAAPPSVGSAKPPSLGQSLFVRSWVGMLSCCFCLLLRAGLPGACYFWNFFQYIFHASTAVRARRWSSAQKRCLPPRLKDPTKPPSASAKERYTYWRLLSCRDDLPPAWRLAGVNQREAACKLPVRPQAGTSIHDQRLNYLWTVSGRADYRGVIAHDYSKSIARDIISCCHQITNVRR